mmetsp:Transcript_30642/g.51814  ORF Transcript_30642/g.51814 Transcript_30642/m.51814 type:complete len:200 (-) Transcript_30642:1429-2028(-)
MSATIFCKSLDVVCSSPAREPPRTQRWTSTMLPRLPQLLSANSLSKAASFSATPLSRWQASSPATMRFPACFSRSSWAMRRVSGWVAALAMRSVSMDTWLTDTITSLSPTNSVSRPPARDPLRMPSMRFVALRKWRAWSKAWKPTTSAQIMLCSSSVARERVRNIWEVGNGMCMKKMMRRSCTALGVSIGASNSFSMIS